MRIFRLFAATLFIAAIAATSAFAQQRGGTTQPAARATPPAAAPAQTGPVPSSKIAYVDTSFFGDEKAGIARYVTAMNNLQREFQPRTTELQNLANRIKTIADEISKLQGSSGPSGVVSQQSIVDKQEEGERLQRELEYKKKDYDALAAKRYTEVVGPISSDIGKALDAFAKQRGITMVFDLSKLGEVIISADPAMDITREFITEYNSKNPATASTAAPGGR